MGLSKITNESFRNEDFDGLSNGNFHQYYLQMDVNQVHLVRIVLGTLY
jgi:hypothetical protein